MKETVFHGSYILLSSAIIHLVLIVSGIFSIFAKVASPELNVSFMPLLLDSQTPMLPNTQPFYLCHSLGNR